MTAFYIYFVLLLNILKVFGNLNGEGHICGRSLGKSIAEAKIVGGYDVGYFKYPWYAALVTSNIVACGGALIGSKTIVSAAHCFKEYLSGNTAKAVTLEGAYNVTLGIYNRCLKEKTQKIFFVQKVHVHEKYKDNDPYYDISLIILKEPTSAYQPICLPKGTIKVRPREGSVPGLGTLSYHGSTPCSLHEARLLIYPDLECRKMMNRTGNDPKKLFRVFCAGYLQGGIDTCQGDSGGPFQVTDEYGTNVLLGVVSFGFHCANPNLLGVYTDVSQYIDWIEQKAGFSATLEGTDNSTEGPVVTGETVPSTPHQTKTTAETVPSTPHHTKTTAETVPSTSHHTKTTKKPHEQHIAHETVWRPISIIIIRDRNKKKKLGQTFKKKVYNKLNRKKTSKKTFKKNF